MAESSGVETPIESSTQAPGLSEDASQPEQKPMSKNALKKAAKAEKLAALKLERRAREKEAKKEKKRQRAEKRAAGELDEDDDETKRQAKKRRVQFGGTVVVDLGFDDMMNDKEIISLCSQLAYTYSANRNASFPFSLVFTSLNGRTQQRLEAWETQAIKASAPASGEVTAAQPEDRPSGDANPIEADEGFAPVPVVAEAIPGPSNTSPHMAHNTLVYLTADTEDELTELRADETYIVGGICDHNRYKNLCLNKARESGIRTARLPIGRYLASLPTRKVLTVNQVFEILVKWVETRDWEESLYSVIPKRKFHQGGKGNHDANIDVIAVEDDEAAGEQGELDASLEASSES
ncbi:guanine-1-methyltransferase-domain-containing protein [Flammula alnicola]|nr:guanine-1-methyltransferase-domain-containing protein [Flammula alnicola]